MEGLLLVISTSNVLLTFEIRSCKKNRGMFFKLIHIHNLFTNLILGSKLLKKAY